MSMLRNVLTYMGLGPDEDYDDGYLDDKPTRRGRHSRSTEDPVETVLDLDRAESDGEAATGRSGAGSASKPGTTAEIGARAAAARNATTGRGGSGGAASQSAGGTGTTASRGGGSGAATARSTGTAAPGASGDAARPGGARVGGAHDLAQGPKAAGASAGRQRQPAPAAESAGRPEAGAHSSTESRAAGAAGAGSPSGSKPAPAARSTTGSPGARAGTGGGASAARPGTSGGATPGRTATASGGAAATSSGQPSGTGPATTRSGATPAAAATGSVATPAGGPGPDGSGKAARVGGADVNSEGGTDRPDERAAELRTRGGGSRPLRAVPPPGGPAQDLVQPENGITVRAVAAEADMASESAAYQVGAPPLRRVTPRHLSPQSFGDAKTLADEFKAEVPVIMNLQGTERELSRRLIDFASGICYALEGSMEKIAPQIFLLTPPEVTVSDEDRRRFERPGRQHR